MPASQSQTPITIVITLEALSTAPLGCYGGSIGETPTIDDLAARGVVFDRWTSPVDKPAGLIRRWLGDCKELLETEAAESIWVTDDPLLNETDYDPIFGECWMLQSRVGGPIVAGLDRTRLAHSFFELMDRIGPDTTLAWLHSAALRECWDWVEVPLPDPDENDDTPHEEFVDDEPETPVEPLQLPDNADVPHLHLDGEQHPDLLFSWMQRYSNQVFVLDTMMDALMQFLGERPFTLIIAGTSGFSFGDNQWIGHRAGPLRSGDLRLPLIVSSDAPLRVPSLTSADQFPNVLRAAIERQPCMTPATWVHRDEEFKPLIETDSDRARRVVTTSSWFLVNETEDVTDAKLFLKPDDVNDINDVARLKPDVVDRLTTGSTI
ncbi:alkaline phosphatase family protein [Roseiconus lacunae]|uniref:hypothetical protein n=1 Tax=Roseiconus lacunae TaxID=2605694 RepID=UPI001E39B271|nr:hypothetical protein [Roseiconus lacunae]MCD0458116.1 hypothetical protein [Roseiconus lacunae]